MTLAQLETVLRVLGTLREPERAAMLALLDDDEPLDSLLEAELFHARHGKWTTAALRAQILMHLRAPQVAPSPRSG